LDSNRGVQPKSTPSLKDALSYAQAGQLDVAAQLCAEILAICPEDADALAVNGFIAHRQGNSPRAIAAYQQAIALRPDISDWHYHLAKACEAANRHAEASAAYRRASELAPDVVAYRNNYVQALLQEWHAATGLPAVGREAYKSYSHKLRSGFFQKYLSGAAVLDIGYRGDFAQAVPIVPQAVGVDLHTPGYDGLHLPWPDQSQNAIYSSHCLEHMSDPVAVLREWYRVIKPGGYLILVVPHQHLYERKQSLPSLWNPDHKQFFTPAGLLAAVEEALVPNSYRVRHLEDNDFLYNYSLLSTDAPSGCYEIELVLERIAPPASGSAWYIPPPPETARFEDSEGMVAHQSGLTEQALEHFKAAIAAAPTWYQPYWHAGICWHYLRRYSDALSAYRQAISANPLHAIVRYHFAKALKDSGDLAAALPAYQAALTLDPDNAEICYSLSLLYLLQGNWQKGWPGYELRLQGSDRADKEHRPITQLPAWKGEPVSEGSGLVVYAEQGMGDSIMCWRFASLLRARFERVLFSVPQALVTLFQGNAPPGVTVVPRIAEPIDEGGYTHHVNMLSLPACLALTPETVSAAPYLQADLKRSALWAERLPKDTRLKVGLAWKGGKLTYAPARDMPFACLLPLLERQDICWVSLQKESDAEAGMLIDLMETAVDFADTAALIVNLDLVIAVDTAVAHLAGALGRPVWLLNRFESEWRWMRNRETTPWYSSMRIFSQPSPGDWQSCIQQMLGCLSEH